MINGIVVKVLAIFVIVALGTCANHFKLIPKGSSAPLSDFVFNIATPCMVFTTMQGQSFAGKTIDNTIWSFIAYTVVTLAIGFVSFAAANLFRVDEHAQIIDILHCKH